VIAGIILDTLEEGIRQRIYTLDAAGIAPHEPRILYYLILHLVAPDPKSRMLEVNQLQTSLNTLTPRKDEDMDAFHDRYAAALRTLLTLGHKEQAMERMTHFIKALAHNDEWLPILEREEQMAPGEWFRGDVRGNQNISSHTFSHMSEIVLRKLRTIQGFRNWIRPTASPAPTAPNVQAHASVNNANLGANSNNATDGQGTGNPPTTATDKCKWCREVLQHRDVNHATASCFQIAGLIEGFSKGDQGRELLATLTEIARSGAQPRYRTRDRAFSAQPAPENRRGNDARGSQGRGRGGGSGRGQPRPQATVQHSQPNPANTLAGQQADQSRAYSAVASASNAAPRDSPLSFMYDDTYHHAYLTVGQSYAAMLPPDTILSDYIIWDSGCDTNTFCDASLTTNCISIEPRQIVGVGTGTADKAGESIFGDVIINTQQGVNLVSQSYVRDSGLYRCKYDEDQDAYVVWSDSATFHFKRLGGLYAIHKDDNALRNAIKQYTSANAFTANTEFVNTSTNLGLNAYAGTADPNTGEINVVLPRHARERAALARRLHVTLGHPGDHAMEKVTQDLANTNLTANDVRNMTIIYGPCVACDQGKAKHMISGGNLHPATLPGEVLHADLITVPTGLKTFSTMVIVVDELSGYGMAVDVISKSETPLYDKVAEVVNWYKAKGAHVRKLKTDPENALKVLKPRLLELGVELEACPVGEHEKHAEARIGVLRAKIRSMEASMHVFLPLGMSTYIVKAANRLLNYIPTHRSGNMSPFTLIHETRPDAKMLTLMFGESVLVTDPGEHTSTNVRDERSNLAIYLGQSDDSPQSGNFLMLNTLTVKTRGISTARPTPHGEHITQLISPLYKGATYTQENNAIDRILTAKDRADFIINTRRQSQPAAPSAAAGKGADEPQTLNNHTEDAPDKGVDNPADEKNDKGVDNPADEKDNKGDDDSIQAQEPATVSTESLGTPTTDGNRRSTRTSRLPQHLAAMATIVLLCTLARDIRQFGKPGEEAATREIRQILDTEALIPTEASSLSWKERKEALECKLFLEAKRDMRIKGRFVGGTGASSQDKTKYEDLSSPTIRFETVAILLKSAATTGMHVAVADVPGAYLHAKFQDLTLESTPGNKRYVVARGMLAKMMAAIDGECAKCVDKNTGDLYLQLNKALYGLIEAAKLWYSEVSTMLIANGFKQSIADPCLFTHEEKQLLVGLYVDDMITFYRKFEHLQWFLSLLRIKYGPPRVQSGGTVDYLNVEISRLAQGTDMFPAGSFVASQEKYLVKLRDAHPTWFWEDTTATAPYDTNLFEDTDETPADSPGEFVSLVMAYLYVCTRARPDIFLAISYLCTRAKSPTKGDEEKLRRICAYIANTIDMVLVFTPSTEMKVVSWVDASYAVHEDAKSHSGTVITAGLERGSPVFVRSRKQKLVSRSSTEAELIALHDASPQVTWTRQLLEELGHTQGPATIFQDNKSTIFMAERGSGNFNRTRHIAVRYFSIKQLIDDKTVAIHYLPTGQMKADPLTKPITGNRFTEWRNTILFQNPM